MHVMILLLRTLFYKIKNNYLYPKPIFLMVHVDHWHAVNKPSGKEFHNGESLCLYVEVIILLCLMIIVVVIIIIIITIIIILINNNNQ